MIPSPSFLKDKLTVNNLDDDQVSVTVVLPQECLQSFCYLLESLTGLFYAAKRESSISLSRSNASARLLDVQANANLAAYSKRLTQSFDSYTSLGMDRKTAVKQIAADLRAETHPWCSPDLVRSTLVAEGRGGRSGRPRRCKS